MAYNFVAVDREQLMLMPPSVADWLPEDHLAWFVVDVVAELDLTGFLSGYRADGRGGAAYDPAMMLAVLIYGYCTGERSSRRIERRLVEDVAFRVVAANQQPNHATIARFRATHQTAIASLFAQVLAVCARQGLLRPGLVAIDGTRMVANASREANRTAEQVAEEILAEAAEIDAGEDAEEPRRDAGSAGSAADLGPRAGRRARLRRVMDELKAEADEHSYEAVMARRAAKEAETGKKLRGKQASPTRQKNRGRQHGNITDPDSRLMNTKDGFVQGYNAQAVATADQFVIAAEVSNQAFDAPCMRAPSPPRRPTSRRPANAAGSAASLPMPATGANTTSTSPQWSPSSHPAGHASFTRSPSLSSNAPRSSTRSKPVSSANPKPPRNSASQWPE
jgi:transposase